MNEYGPKNNRGYRYILVVIDNFSKLVSTIPLINKYAQSLTDTFSKIVKNSKRKRNLLETDDGTVDVIKIFNKFQKNNSIERYSRNKTPGEVFAERFNKTERNLLKNQHLKKERRLDI